YQGQAFFDAARPGDREMLVRAGSLPIPGIVRDVQDPGRSVAFVDRRARKDDLITNKWREGRQPRQGDGPRAGAGCDVDVARCDLAQRQDLPEGNVFTEWNEM